MTAPTIDTPIAVPQTSGGGNDNDDGFAHKFRHEDIEKSLASGVPVTALCGYRKSLTNPNKGSRPACPKCMELVDLAESMEA